MRRPSCFIFFLFLAIGAAASCGDSEGENDGGSGDGGSDGQTDGQTDGSQFPLTQCEDVNKTIGRACNATNRCPEGQVCAALQATGDGVCTCGGSGNLATDCRPDDSSTALVNEDNCPGSGGANPDTECVTLPGTRVGSVVRMCARRCSPQLGQNTCGTGSSIHCVTAMQRFSSSSDQSLCLITGCRADTDCPIVTGRSCNHMNQANATLCASGETCVNQGTQSDPDYECVGTGGPTGQKCNTADVSRCNTGELCEELTQGVFSCALPGTCDQTSGICAARSDKAGTFNAQAKTGDPCRSDLDCAASAACLTEETEQGSGDKLIRNGYCVKSNCNFQANEVAFACDTGTTCMALFNTGFCLKSCDIRDGSTCRGGQNGETRGDFECQGWDALLRTTQTPVCIWSAAVACSFFDTPSARASGLACDTLGIPQGNATAMMCRDRKTGAVKQNQLDPDGVCADTTHSGQTHPPDGGLGDASSMDGAIGDSGADGGVGDGAAADGSEVDGAGGSDAAGSDGATD